MSTSSMSTDLGTPLDYVLVDVFAENALEGNMLAIFTDARDLSTGRMQALARAMNLPETTFILPADDPSTEHTRGVRVRIFTTREELDFAGHPTLGTAAWLYLNHPTLRGTETITLDLNAGPIPVTFAPMNHLRSGVFSAGVFGTMRQLDPAFGSIHDHATIAHVLNVPLDALDTAHPIQTVSTGMAFCIVPFRSLEAIQRLAIPQTAAQAYLAASDAKFFFCVAPAGWALAPAAPAAHFHNRMQFYTGEDPATGSASGCAIAYLVRHGIVPSGRPTIFEQGIEILRPSRIHVRATLLDSDPDQESAVANWESPIANRDTTKVVDVFVGGRTIPVASGQFFLP